MVPPVGTIAMLFTDIEGSTALAARLGRAWPGVLAEHHEIVGGAIAAEGGHVDGTEGDAFFATFADPAAAARAAVAAQRALQGHESLRVRMSLHVGFVERNETGYVGLEVHRAARVGAAAHGGQLLMTAAARETIGDTVPVELIGAHRLKDFPAPVQLYCAVIDGRGASSFPPPRTQEVRPTNLPAGEPTLVGRDEDLERLRAALLEEGERLVTLTGRGGAGKTSLALLAGARLLDSHAGGVWWVNLSAVASPEAVEETIATAVGAERDVHRTAREALSDHLRDRGPTLLILDNMEHLLAAAEALCGLLDAVPDLRLLATSQLPLRVPAERVMTLDALDEASALELIGRVARRRGANVADDPALRDVARLLDGLPLALELAAARLALLSPGQLCDRLRGSLNLLRDSSASRPARQRSLEATVQWTFGLLEEAPRNLFARLGAFAGAVDLEELEAVCGQDGLDVLEALSVLLDAALVRRVETGDGRIRFGLPQALREIASRMLDAAPDGERWREAHAQRQGELVWAGCTIVSDESARAAATAADEECAAALRWARGELAERLAAARATLVSGQARVGETVQLLAPLLSAPPRDPDVRALVYVCYAHLLVNTDRLDEALEWAERAVACARDPILVCEALLGRAHAHDARGAAKIALKDVHAAVAVARELGGSALAFALLCEAESHITAGAFGEAAQRLEEAERVGRPVGAPALAYLDTEYGDLAAAAGRPADALEPYARALERAQRRGQPMQVLIDLRGMANALAALHRDEDALEVLALAEMQAIEIGGRGDLTGHRQGNASVLAAAARAGEPRAAELRARGHAVPAAMRVARAVALAHRDPARTGSHGPTDAVRSTAL